MYQYMYKLWKKGKARAHQLRLLGVPEEKLKDYKLTFNSYWSMSKNLNIMLVNSILYEKKSKIRINAINLEEYLTKSLFNFKLSRDIFVTRKRTDRKFWISNNNCYCL